MSKPSQKRTLLDNLKRVKGKFVKKKRLLESFVRPLNRKMTRKLKKMTGYDYRSALNKTEPFLHGSSSGEIDLGVIHGHLNAYFRIFEKDHGMCRININLGHSKSTQIRHSFHEYNPYYPWNLSRDESGMVSISTLFYFKTKDMSLLNQLELWLSVILDDEITIPYLEQLAEEFFTGPSKPYKYPLESRFSGTLMSIYIKKVFDGKR